MQSHSALVFVLALAMGGASTVTALAAGDDHHGSEAGTAGDPANVTREVVIEMGDNYYDLEAIEVTAGETVRFVVKNTGAFVHEFNIGSAHQHAEHQKEMLLMMEHGMIEPDRINHDMMKMDMGGDHTMSHDDPNSVLLEPGQSAEIVWQFPEKGQLEFACNLPGHYDSGMVGRFDLKNGS